MPDRDYVDLIVEEWARERPDLDVSGVDVIGRVSRLSRYLDRAIQRSFAPFGLNSAGFYVLAALRRSGPPYHLSPTQLYGSLLVSSGAMTNRLDRLEAAGLVTRIPDPADGRSSVVALTEEGRRVADEVIRLHAANEIRLLSGLTSRQRADLARLLRSLLLAYDDRPRPARAAGRQQDTTAGTTPTAGATPTAGTTPAAIRRCSGRRPRGASGR